MHIMPLSRLLLFILTNKEQCCLGKSGSAFVVRDGEGGLLLLIVKWMCFVLLCNFKEVSHKLGVRGGNVCINVSLFMEIPIYTIQ